MGKLPFSMHMAILSHSTIALGRQHRHAECSLPLPALHPLPPPDLQLAAVPQAAPLALTALCPAVPTRLQLGRARLAARLAPAGRPAHAAAGLSGQRHTRDRARRAAFSSSGHCTLRPLQALWA